MSKKSKFRTENLSSFLIYILGHRPYDFGLLPDQEGFISYKDLLQALHEEPEWRHIRQGAINELLMGDFRSLFETDGQRIKSIEKHWKLDITNLARVMPKILYIGIRKKAHPVVIEHGLREIPGNYHILSGDREMAERIGRRHDQDPVLIEVMAHRAQNAGTRFFSFGGLFLTPVIEPKFIAGPPVPKALFKFKEDILKKKVEKPRSFEAGTFILDLNRENDYTRSSKARKKKGWKEEARKLRRRK
ncbi:MAG: RNA 2'-phosphotransferase [Deltaproteobacteria bacterium]|nr:RNA 2'-phosphotransferase [Deltaproteobacteria bacterium]